MPPSGSRRASPPRNKLSSTITCAKLTPRLRLVICLIFSLARSTLLGEWTTSTTSWSGLSGISFTCAASPVVNELAVQEQPMTEKLTFPDRSDGALFPVHPELEFPFQKPCYRFHHSLPRRQRPHVDIAIVSVAAEAMSAVVQ